MTALNDMEIYIEDHIMLEEKFLCIIRIFQNE